MKTRVLRASLAVVCFCIMHNVYTQNLQIHYTYFTDSTSIGQETRQRVAGLLVKLGEVLDHPDISTSLPIDVVFLHPDYLGSLQFKDNVKHNAQQSFVQWWNAKYDGEMRLLFLILNSGGQYHFNHFEATQNVQDLQLPTLVYDYIRQQVITPYANQPKEAVYWGLNAIKNAFDRRYKEKLVTIAPAMLEFKYYYKGYAYSGHDYYFAEYEDIDRQGQNVAKELFFLYEGTYYPVYLDEVQGRRAVAFDKLFEHPIHADLGNNDRILISNTNINNLYLHTQSGYIPNSQFDISFDKHGILHFAGTEYYSFSELPAGELKNYVTGLINSRKVKEVQPNSSDFMNEVETEELLYVNKRYTIHTGTTRHTVRTQLGTPQEATPVTPKMGWSISSYWRDGFEFAQPTWCNMFASDLSNLIFGKIGVDYPVPYGTWGKTASEIYDHFVAGVDYIEFSRNQNYGQEGINNFIWTNYVNKGFPVYFSSRGNPGHIETAFPSGYITNGTNRRYFEDESCGITRVTAGSIYLVVGAGGRTGIKSYNEYDWLREQKTKVFLYLGYLKKE